MAPGTPFKTRTASPGPGTYKAAAAVGRQVVSSKRTGSSYRFSGASRSSTRTYTSAAFTEGVSHVRRLAMTDYGLLTAHLTCIALTAVCRPGTLTWEQAQLTTLALASTRLHQQSLVVIHADGYVCLSVLHALLDWVAVASIHM